MLNFSVNVYTDIFLSVHMSSSVCVTITPLTAGSDLALYALLSVC